MRTKVFICGEDKKCYIDKKEFEDLVKIGDLKIKKEFANERFKLCDNGVNYYLMDDEDWIIEVSSKEKYRGQTEDYQVHCNFGWFPDEAVAVEYRKAFRGWDGSWRYETVLVDGIDFTESGGSMNLYTNDRNGKWREMLISNGFKVVDVD